MNKRICRMLSCIGVALLLFTGALAFCARSLPVTLLSEPREAQRTVQLFLNALNRGEFSQAGHYLYGQPELEDAPEFENPVVAALWQQYVQSLQGQLSGGCYASDAGICQNVDIASLDIQGILPSVESQYEALLPQRSQERGDGAINLENGSYREEFVLSVLEEAVNAVLPQDAVTVTRTVSLTLVYREGQWWILPQGELMDVLAGGMTAKGG